MYAQEPAPVAAPSAAQAAPASGPNAKLDRMKMMGVSTPMGLGAPRGGAASAPRLRTSPIPGAGGSLQSADLSTSVGWGVCPGAGPQLRMCSSVRA